MASLKNIAKANQKIHRERGQPEERKHLGFLEKKKDYKLRAKDFQQKRDALRVLHRKALEKNPDEFYFHMVNSRQREGVHTELEKVEETPEQKKLMSTQDLKYISFKLRTEQKKIEKLKANLHFLDMKGRQANTHTVFVESTEEAINFDPAKYLRTHPSLVDRVYNRPKLDQLATTSVMGSANKKTVNEANVERKKTYAELTKRIHREKELRIVFNKLTAKQNVAMTMGTKPKVVKKGNATRAPILKWPLERQR